ncbi:MAG: transcriptional regulator, partial [bacterium]|nr:transcriptional regulator [bacterium]
VGEHFTGFSRMGAINAFGAVTGRYQITVVGDVPRITVDKVGNSIRPAK